jgi:uncharacterized coiled-coil DUF342 family protein
MSDLEIQKEITQLKKQVSDLHKQLTEHNSSVSDKLSQYNRDLTDTSTQAHKIKHEMEGFGKSFEGFAKIFNKNEAVMFEIRDLLMKSNWEARISEVKEFKEANINLRYEITDMQKRITDLEKSDEDTTKFKTGVNTVLNIVKVVGFGQLTALIIWAITHAGK